MSISEGSSSPYELDDLDLFLMEEYRVTDHIVDNGSDREGKERKKCKDAILKDMKCDHDRGDAPELALVVEKLLPEDILIIVK